MVPDGGNLLPFNVMDGNRGPDGLTEALPTEWDRGWSHDLAVLLLLR